MSQAAQPTGPTSPGGEWPPRQPGARGGAWATGGVTFAGVLMVCSGLLALFQGIAAVTADAVYYRIGSYIYKMNLTGWGTIHIVIGALVLATGVGLLMHVPWARVVGMVLVAFSLITQFLFLPYAPVWSLVLLAIDVFVLWALASGHESRQEAVG
ncbi:MULTISPECIES: DUF7144 family membrane protein [Streptomyces]|uniref:DUF7144 domain-containing protein n=1 Tax=Streptomyces argyrophylli TaxID=2726118 RepID=A0A6M4PHD2_9ACTN|nr:MULTISPECIES: hypothetical protein [Streptomyces]QJS09066.1 hypothetical protein HKX69_05635 [Streptomyces argyrophyllae]